MIYRYITMNTGGKLDALIYAFLDPDSKYNHRLEIKTNHPSDGVIISRAMRVQTAASIPA